ncbi:hypothetical protein KKF84_05685 [Myxococcota bacterium]|nr:hypothetical protein [Myxococcota bacterium]
MEGNGKHVTVLAKLVSYDPRFPFSETHMAGHDDGVAPLAGFIISSPERLSGRRFGVLFKYASGFSPKGLKNATGQLFALKLPSGFFAGNAKTLDNSLVLHVKTANPARAPAAVDSKAASPNDPPKITPEDLTCSSDRDCVAKYTWEYLRGGWCTQCTSRALNRSGEKRIEAWYYKHHGKSCPARSCLSVRTQAACVAGKCKMVPMPKPTGSKKGPRKKAELDDFL